MIRTIPGLSEITRRAQKARLRGAHSVIDAQAFDLEAEQCDLDEFFGEVARTEAVPRRHTDALVLAGAASRVLDDMIETHGLKSILATLRALCDSRCDNGLTENDEFGAMLDAEEKSADFRSAADALEQLTAQVTV